MSDITRSFIIVMGVLIYGTIGFSFFESIPPATAFFWSVMTITTVGYYGEVSPVTPGGLFIAATAVIAGLGTLLYLVQNVFAGPLVEAKLKEVLGMGIEIKKNLSNHTVVCGVGDIGESVLGELEATGNDFVVIEKNPDRIKTVENRGYMHFKGVVQGDATHEEVLIKSRIETAKHLILTSRDDANNVFITLTARNLNPRLHVVASASEASAIKKLYFAGADMVISTPEIGGMLLANASVRPSVVRFLQDAMTAIDVGGVEIATAVIPASSRFVGKTLGVTEDGDHALECKAQTGALIVGVARGSDVIPNPPGGFVLETGDEIILLGRRKEIENARELFSK